MKMLTSLVSKLWWRRSIYRNGESWAELESFPRSRPDVQKQLLAERLLAQIQYFAKREDALPEWREAAKIRNPQDLWRIWPSLPILTKLDLQNRFEPQAMQKRFGLTGVTGTTGGSTGEPTAFFHDTAMLKAMFAASTYSRLQMGWKPGMATVIVWGSERDIGRHVSWKSSLGLKLLRDHLVDGYHLTSATTDRVLDIIRREAPVAIYGFTSMLEFLAQDILDRQLRVEPGAVQTAWNGGELLFPSQSELFAKAFHTSIHNRYGGRELSVMACQFRRAGPIEVLRPWLFLEVINDEGKPVSPGETGRLIWTSTICRGTPFLRYDVEDLGRFAAAHETEAGVDALDSIEGRVASVIRFPNGKSINNIYWNHLFKEYPEIRQFQVVIRNDGSLQILLRGSGFTPERERTLRRVLETFMEGLAIEFRWVERIPLTARGKHVQVVRESAGGPAPLHQ